MKQLLFIFSLLICSCFPAQQKLKDFKNIMSSKSIYEIDAFLNVAHPNDPRRTTLKPRLMGLLREYLKNAHPEDQRVKEFQEKLALLKKRPNTKISFEEMNAIIKEKQIKKYKEELAAREKAPAGTALSTVDPAVKAANKATYPGNISNPEAEEFNALLNISPDEHKQKTVKLLNKLFDNDPSSTDVIVLVENKSECNIIMRIEGASNIKYNLPVPAKSENSIVVTKGDYLFSSLVCGVQYASQKTVQKGVMVSLDLKK